VKIVLGSSSPFRQALLKKLQLDFECCSPEIDESPIDNEMPSELVQRLSCAKAREVAKQYEKSLIIGSDQVAVFDDKILGKPGTHDKAVKQLASFSGKTVQFITGLCLYNSVTTKHQYHQDITEVKFRTLSHLEIEDYLKRDKPYQCAGSFKSEGLGIALS